MTTQSRAMPVASWEDFFTAYEAAHQNPTNRWVHHATHVGAALGALPTNWLAHRIFEGNTPAFFAPADAWGKAQVALGGLAWTAATLPGDLRRVLASR